ncbi:ABC transporter substrate-binding protein [Cohnella fermenti]|uniref:ABC transporter substrate-binding protein n=1 Tax=Cohnella fermenti TaxID=2565925 RepID=A0A4S4BTN6_9BACL|nr:ABC transporter substrate-binding protein [Cohnella fermenti]THF76224.1 ABC transporter substrate-binding protein [Cohnella fermenti]
MLIVKRLLPLASIVLLMLLLAACGSSDKTENGASASSPAASSSAEASADASPSSSPAASAESGVRTLTDAMGHTVEVPAHPERIIAPFLEDPLAALGLKPVAQWGAAGQPQQYLQDKLADVPVLNMDEGLTAEETLSYTPDLIIFASPAYMAKIDYDQFSKIAPTYVLAEDGADWQTSLENLGALLGEEDAVKTALEQYDSKLEAAKAQLGSLPSEKTAVLLLPQDDKSFKLFGPNFYGGKMLYQTLGFQQPAVLNGDFEAYSMESLADLKDVDYIFVISGTGRPKPPTDNALWQALGAVKAGHVFEADSGHWFNDNLVANELIVQDVVSAVHE